MKKFLQYSIVLVSSVLFTVSCGGGGSGGGSGTPSGNSNPTADQLKESIRQFSDITDAQGFVLTGDNTASARPALTSAQMRTANLDVNLDPNSLYKVKPDGTLERVVIADDSSEEITRGLIQPAAVRDIDQNFMIMYFTIRDESEQALGIIDDTDMALSLSAYLVHKPTGLAYNMDSLGEDAGWVDCDVQDDRGFFGGSIDMTPGGGSYGFVASQFELKECRLSGAYPLPRFTTDDQSNIYLRANPDRATSGETFVFKIDTTALGGSTINATQLHTQFPLVGNKWGWEVDPAGEYLILQSGAETYYMDIATGVFTNLEQELASDFTGVNQIESGSVYKDLEGKMYIWGNPTAGNPRLFKLESVGTGNFQFVDMGELNDFTSAGTGSVDLQEDMERMVINGTLLYAYFINSTSTGEWVPQGGFLEIDADIGIVLHPEPASQFANNNYTFATLSNGYFYYFGEYVNFPADTVYRYNPATKSGILFPTNPSPLSQNNLEVSEVRVIDDDEVWFRAVRTSDSATVFGTLDLDAGTLEITGTTEAAEPVVFIMQAILPSDFLSIDGSYSDWSIDLRVTTDASNDGSAGHELTYLSHQQSATQFFALVEFLDNDIQLADAATILEVGGMYEIVVQSDAAYIVDLLDDSETTFNEVGGISAIGQAVEFSTPLAALTGIGSTPVVTVRRVSLQDVTVSSSFNVSDHTVSVTLPRPLIVGDLITIQLTADFVLEIDIDSATLIETAGPTSTVKTGASTGLGTASISVVISDAEVGSPGSLSPTTTDQLDITEDSM